MRLYRDVGDYSRGIKGDTKDLSYGSYSPYSHEKSSHNLCRAPTLP